MDFNLPKNWNQISIQQYQELIECEQIEEHFNKTIEALSILLDEDPEVIENLDIDILIELEESLKFLKSPIKNKPKQVLFDKYYLKKFDDLTLGEFIDLEYIFQEPIKNLHVICALLYKQCYHDNFGNIIYEPHIYNIFDRSNLFINTPISDCYNLILEYNTYRELFINSYEPLFQTDIAEETPEDLVGIERIEYEKEMLNQQIKAKWSWEALIYELANKDITKIDDILKMKLILVFNMLSMKKSLNI